METKPIPNTQESRIQERAPFVENKQERQFSDNTRHPVDRPTDRHVPKTERHERLLPHPSLHDNTRHVNPSDNRPDRHIQMSERGQTVTSQMPFDTRQDQFDRNPERLPEKPDRLPSSDSRSFDRVENRAPARQRSLPASSSGSIDQPTKSTTMPKFPSEDAKDAPYENVGVEKKEVIVPG